MGIKELLQQRRSIRAFSDQPVSQSKIEAILLEAGLSASGGNLQPWKVYVLAGQARQGLIDAVASKLAQGLTQDNTDAETYPARLKEPYRTRRYDCGMALYDALGIDRKDRPARQRQWEANLTFFGAPVGLMFTMDRLMGKAQYLDLGIFFQTVMLSAQERGLSTCAQRSWAPWGQTISEQLNIADDEQVIVGMALGYADTTDAVNQYEMGRAGLDEIASFDGF